MRMDLKFHATPHCQNFNQTKKTDGHANRIYNDNDGMKQTHPSKLSKFQLATPILPH